MSDRLTDAQKLDAISDALADSLLEMTDDEVLEDTRLTGIDPDDEATRLRRLMLATVKVYQQRVLRAAREAYNAQAEKPRRAHSIPSSPEERRNLFSVVLAKQPQYAELFTAQHREFADLTDDDIETYLEDLAELGVLEKLRLADGDTDK